MAEETVGSGSNAFGGPITPRGSGKCAPLIGPDFTINNLDSKKCDYQRSGDHIPFGLTTPGPISLRNRKKPYKLEK